MYTPYVTWSGATATRKEAAPAIVDSAALKFMNQVLQTLMSQTAALEAARQALENTRERMPARPQQSGTSFTYINTRSSTQQSR